MRVEIATSSFHIFMFFLGAVARSFFFDIFKGKFFARFYHVSLLSSLSLFVVVCCRLLWFDLQTKMLGVLVTPQVAEQLMQHRTHQEVQDKNNNQATHPSKEYSLCDPLNFRINPEAVQSEVSQDQRCVTIAEEMPFVKKNVEYPDSYDPSKWTVTWYFYVVLYKNYFCTARAIWAQIVNFTFYYYRITSIKRPLLGGRLFETFCYVPGKHVYTPRLSIWLRTLSKLLPFLFYVRRKSPTFYKRPPQINAPP